MGGGGSKRFQAFKRLTTIHSHSSPTEWSYDNTEANPADDGSKALKGYETRRFKEKLSLVESFRDLWQKESE